MCSTACGNGLRSGIEDCDDGNVGNGDGCSSGCAVETATGFTCTGGVGVKSSCGSTCGNGLRGTGENCDDGGVAPGDGCSSSCTVEAGWKCTGGMGVKSTCTDDNECTLGTHNCDTPAIKSVCTNVPGSFTCACNNAAGYGGGSGILGTCVKDTVPPAPVLACAPGGLTEVAVTWGAIPQVSGVSVTVRLNVAGTAGYVGVIPGSPNAGNVTVKDASTSYVITATAENPVGTSPASVISCFSANSNNSTVGTLTINSPANLTLVPAFDPFTTQYKITTAALTPFISFTAVGMQAQASVAYVGDTSLGPGSNTVLVVCTAHDGVTKTTYTINVVNPTVPAAPAAPTFSKITHESLTVSWTAPNSGGTPITTYSLYRNGTLVAGSIPAGTTTFSDPGPLFPLTVYEYSVKATNAVGTSSPGTPATVLSGYPPSTVTTFDPPVGGPGGGVLVTVTGTNFGLSAASVLSVTLAGIEISSPGKITWVSETQIIVQSPPLPGSVEVSGPVSVKTTSGAGTASTTVFTVQAVVPTPPNQVICELPSLTSLEVVFTFTNSSGGVYVLSPYVLGARVSVEEIAPANGTASGNNTATLFSGTVTVPSSSFSNTTVQGRAQFSSLQPGTEYAISVVTFTSAQDAPAALLRCFTPSPPPVEGGMSFGNSPIVFSVTPVAGYQTGNTTVTITGAFFGNSPNELLDITLAGVSCAFTKTWINNATVSCVSEPSSVAGVGTVVVRTFIGASEATSATWEYLLPPPAVLDILPRVFAPEGGTIVTIRGSFFGNSSNVDITALIGGTPCAETEWVSSSEVLCTTPPATSGEFMGTEVTVKVGDRMSAPASSSNLAAGEVFGYGKECIGCAWYSRCVDGVCVGCITGFTNPPKCTTPLVTVRPVGHVAGTPLPPLVTSEDGLSTSFEIVLGASPASTVSFDVVFSDDTEATAEPFVVSISPNAWSTPATVTVKGFDDKLRDGNVTYAISFSVREGPKEFLATSPMLPTFRVVNMDSAPRIEKISPELAPELGRNVTLSISNLDPAFEIYVGGVLARVLMEVTNTPEINEENFDDEVTDETGSGTDNNGGSGSGGGTGAPVRARALQAPGSLNSLAGLQRFIVELPIMVKGYVTVTVVNGGGTQSSLERVLFVTDDCPKPGQFGRGVNCKDCPEGATCPGGNRIWPGPGFWNTGEDSGFIVECEPHDACKGGKESECRKGHKGQFCATCENEYYSLNGLCTPCPKQETAYVFALADAILWSLFALAAVGIKDRMTLSYVVMTVRALQQIGGIGQSASAKLPHWLLEVYNVLHLFSGDYSFLKPDCIKPAPFFATFFYSLVYNFLIFVPVFVALPLARAVSVFRARSKKNHMVYVEPENPENEEKRPEDEEERAARILATSKYWKDRFIRCVFIWLTTIYLSVTALCFEAISCQRSNDGYFYMITRPENRCYVDTWHRILCLVATIILLGFTMGYPISVFVWLIRKRNKDRLHKEERFMERFNFFYEFYSPQNPLFWVMEYPIACVVAAGKSYLKPNINYQMSISVAVFGAKFLYILAVRPFIDTATDCIQAGLALIALVAINMNFFQRNGFFDATPAIADYVGMGLVALMCLVVVGMIAMIVYLVTKKDVRKFLKDKMGIGGSEEKAVVRIVVEDESSSGDEADIKNVENDSWFSSLYSKISATFSGTSPEPKVSVEADVDTSSDGEEVQKKVEEPPGWFQSLMKGFMSNDENKVKQDNEQPNDLNIASPRA